MHIMFQYDANSLAEQRNIL